MNDTIANPYPLQILIAEDNAINQFILCRMLENLGFLPEVVSNGEEVMAALEKQSFDLVLLDIMMPKMDGIETARWIRKNIDKEKQPKIVAITADTSILDLQNCQQIGIDTFLLKPIDSNELKTLLLEMNSDKLSCDYPTNRESLSNPEINRLDNVLKESLNQYSGGNKTIFYKLLHSWLSDADHLVDTLEQAVAEGTMDDVYRLAHTLKSTSASLGIRQLSEICSQLQTASKTDANVEIEKQFRHLKQEYANVRIVAERMLGALKT